MKEKVLNILDIVFRSIVLIFVNYILISMKLSFKSSILGLLATITNYCMALDYYTAVKTKTESRIVAVLLIIICVIVRTVIIYYAGYIKGTITSF